MLGASHYTWSNEDSSTSKEFTREVVARHGVINENPRARTLSGFFKCLLNEKSPPLETRGELWSSILFYNLIQEPMIGGTNTSATNTEKETAWKVFKKLVPILKPKICIVWGVSVLHYWANNYGEFKDQYKRKVKISGCYPRESVITIDGHEVSICVIKHPSQHFSSTKWREYLLSQHKDKLQKIISS